MKIILVIFISVASLFASSIQEMEERIQQIEDSRESKREVLSIDVDIREHKRESTIQRRKTQSVVVSKMIQLRDQNRG